MGSAVFIKFTRRCPVWLECSLSIGHDRRNPMETSFQVGLTSDSWSLLLLLVIWLQHQRLTVSRDGTTCHVNHYTGMEHTSVPINSSTWLNVVCCNCRFITRVVNLQWWKVRKKSESDEKLASTFNLSSSGKYLTRSNCLIFYCKIRMALLERFNSSALILPAHSANPRFCIRLYFQIGQGIRNESKWCNNRSDSNTPVPFTIIRRKKSVTVEWHNQQRMFIRLRPNC